MSLRNQLKGVGVALVTPFQKNTEVDYDALSGIIDFVIEGGVDYLVTLGTTAETPTLSSEEKKAIINFTCEKVNNRIPVVVGMGSNNTRELIEELQTYPLENSVAVLSAGPYYSRPSQEGLYQHYKAIAKASPKPVILYNVPSRTGRNISASTVIRLAKEEENIIGIKEAGGDFAQCMQILRDVPGEFLVVVATMIGVSTDRLWMRSHQRGSHAFFLKPLFHDRCLFDDDLRWLRLQRQPDRCLRDHVFRKQSREQGLMAETVKKCHLLGDNAEGMKGLKRLRSTLKK
jgi:4-hydroxy-tetrahydrodipicolinate synthase